MSKALFNNNVTPLNESEITIQIENLVKFVITSYQPIKLSRYGRRSSIKFDGAFYLKILQILPIYLSIYNPPPVGQLPSHDYSEHLEIFWRACIETGLIGIKYMRYPFQLLTMSRAIVLVDLICQYANTSDFRRPTYDRLYETNSKRNNLRDLAFTLHQRFSRLLVIRVDFKYRKECQHLVRIDDVFKHRDDIQQLKISDPLLKHSVGSALLIEQGGKNGGYHIHAVFYFLGHDFIADWYIAEQIGKIWVKVTGDLGGYYNVHDKKLKFQSIGKLGIGMIYRSDQAAVRNSIEAISYLAKPEKKDQYLRIKPHNARTLVTGMSKKNKRKNAY